MTPDPRELFQVFIEPDLASDNIRYAIVSRYFDIRVFWSLSEYDAPPELEAMAFLRSAFEPLFVAYAGMPFPKGVLGPMLRVTMDQLAPSVERRLRQIGSHYIRPGRLRRMTATEARAQTYFPRRGEDSRRFLDNLEAAFRLRDEEGGRVSLETATHVDTGERGQVVTAAPEDGPFLSLRDFPRMYRQEPRPRRDPLVNYLAADLDAALFYGDGPRINRDPRAMERSLETLKQMLNPVQLAEFVGSGDMHFPVVGQDGRLYKVHRQFVYSVTDESGWYYCVQLSSESRCPIFDHMLAQKLLLEADIQRFMRVANKKHPATGRYAPGRDDGQPRLAIAGRDFLRTLGNFA